MELKQVFPIFEEGRILKRDALDLLRDYAPEFASLLFEEHGSGVMAGFRIREQGGTVFVGPGILKDRDSFFCMRREAAVPFDQYGRAVRIVLRRIGEHMSADFREERYELSLEPVRESGEGEYELGRFLLESGARLRAGEDYRDFHDLVTEFNTLNPVHIRYACRGGHTLSPLVMRMYGKGVLRAPSAEMADIAFGLACLNGGHVSGEAIREYLSAKGETAGHGGGNRELYEGLAGIYARLVSGGGARRRPKQTGGKTLIE